MLEIGEKSMSASQPKILRSFKLTSEASGWMLRMSLLFIANISNLVKPESGVRIDAESIVAECPAEIEACEAF